MGASPAVILKASTPEYGRVVIEASDGARYHADLSFMSKVHCYPRTKPEWDLVAPDAHGLALVWASRFEVHVDQIIASAYRRERLDRTA